MHSHSERGQSVVELALILPVLLLMLLGIADLARVYTTMLTVEAAAREAADFGTLYPWYWEGDESNPNSNYAKTVAGMKQRACLASSNLPEYIGPDDNCSNPTFDFVLDPTPAGVSANQCHLVARGAVPCNVVVTLRYNYRLIVPVGILGVPTTLPFERQSVFAISDFEIDGPLAPTLAP